MARPSSSASSRGSPTPSAPRPCAMSTRAARHIAGTSSSERRTRTASRRCTTRRARATIERLSCSWLLVRTPRCVRMWRSPRSRPPTEAACCRWTLRETRLRASSWEVRPVLRWSLRTAAVPGLRGLRPGPGGPRGRASHRCGCRRRCTSHCAATGNRGTRRCPAGSSPSCSSRIQGWTHWSPTRMVGPLCTSLVQAAEQRSCAPSSTASASCTQTSASLDGRHRRRTLLVRRRRGLRLGRRPDAWRG
mmetsp:Transcript_25232/g.71870  ORF Transcript_25232/g.71870 Transcript_25232/m.71870 type:complete len:248 (+) Transcript_25232:966-1709(+)